MDVNSFLLNLVCISIDINDDIRIRFVLFLFHICYVSILKLITYKKDYFIVILTKDTMEFFILI